LLEVAGGGGFKTRPYAMTRPERRIYTTIIG
jgi:hypothetical protein